MPISMDTFSWQVVATFAAAAGAVAVGWRQVGIADGQRLIAKEQAETARAAIKVAEAQAFTARLAQRTALFDKRFAVYQAVQAYISTRMEPSGFKIRQGDDEFQDDPKKVYVAIHQSRFLFSEITRKSIEDACALADEFVLIYGEQHLFPSDDFQAEKDKRVHAAQLELIKVLRSLDKRMGDEMKLYNQGA